MVDKPRRLEIGPGHNPRNGRGWDFMDVLPRRRVNILYRWGSPEPMPIEDETYDFVYASHVIEHVAWYEIKAALKEVYRIIKPGGQFEVWTVDFEFVVSCYLKRKIGDNWRRMNRGGNPMMWVSGRVFAFERGKGSENWHKSLFDYEYLEWCIKKAGFSKVERIYEPEKVGKTHGVIELGAMATK